MIWPALLWASIAAAAPEDCSGSSPAAGQCAEAPAAEGMATLRVRCHQGCRVLLGGQPFVVGPEPFERSLPLGTHAVEIRSIPDDPGRRRVFEVVLDRRGQVQPIEFGAEAPEPMVVPPAAPSSSATPAPAPAPEVDPPDREPSLPAPPPRRLLSRKVEIGGIVAGTVLATGILANPMHNRCFVVSDDRTTCGWLWQTKPGASIAFGVGVGLVVTAAILLAIDEPRVARARGLAARLAPGHGVRF